MDKFVIKYVDCTWAKCKNYHRFNTIDMWFSINTNDEFYIEYFFHNIDFSVWKKIIEIHKINVGQTTLYNENNEKIDILKLNNNLEYYILKIVSKDPNLYRNINLIFYLEDKNWNNMNEMLKQNTHNKEGAL